MASEPLSYLIDHVFLPPCLPQKDDYHPIRSSELLRTCLDGLENFLHHVPEDERSSWSTLTTMLRRMRKIRDNEGILVRDEFMSAVRSMSVGDVLAVHVVAQNAGLIIRRLEDVYVFELFELSPRSEDVTKTKGRLVRCFPGPSIAVGIGRIEDETFLKELANCIVELDRQTPTDAIPKSWKAGAHHEELRDTVDPRFATELVASILRAVGTPHYTQRVYKRTRDDVMYSNVLVPWRRSPMWLLLRVAFQTTLINADPARGKSQYKYFMLFVLNRILAQATEAQISSDLLYSMIAKIVRRVLKIDGLEKDTRLGPVKAQLGESKEVLTQRWKTLTTSPNQPQDWVKWLSSSPSPFSDTELKLKTLGPYLRHIEARASPNVNRDAKLHTAPHLDFGQNELPLVPQLRGEEDALSYIVELELWVQSDLSEWVGKNAQKNESCKYVSSLLNGYLSLAQRLYQEETEDRSRMLLTLMSIWVALDMCACHHCPLLEDYCVPLPPHLFEPLLLSNKAQLEQLDCVEQYLDTRRSRAEANYPCVFSSIGDPKCFTVRYVDQSPAHEELRRRIVENATQEKSSKLKEFQKKRETYRRLMNSSSKRECDMTEIWRKRECHVSHSSNCKKCDEKGRADSLSIDVHEWPLPDNPLILKTVLFYLDIPSSIFAWLETTFKLIVDVLSPGRDVRGNQNNLHTLNSYQALRLFGKRQHSRLQPASSSKPVMNSHYRNKSISTSEDTDVCVKNGMRFLMYDTFEFREASKRLGTCAIRGQCTVAFGQGQYKKLEYTKNETGHTSNGLIANQTDCPTSMSLHEHYAFGYLRAGHRLQWFNLERELIAQVMDFNHREVQILIAHAIYQAGPRGNGGIYRESHLPLADETFVSRTISLLADAVSAIGQNWQSVVAMQTFTMIARRVLSVTTSIPTQIQCFKLLRNARSITQRWTRELNLKLQEAGENDVLQLTGLVLEAALTCYETFDVDARYLPNLLSTNDDFADVMECSIFIYDRSPPNIGTASGPTRSLLYRHFRISHQITSFLLCQHIENGLHCAVGRVWAGYVRSTCWTKVESKEVLVAKTSGGPKSSSTCSTEGRSNEWVVAQTPGGPQSSMKLVHFNVRSGKLLVDGSPLARLPKEYDSHATYTRLFGKRILEVVPSTVKGMRFESRSEVFGHQVHFTMDSGNLIVRAVKGTQVYEILPVHATINDFPPAMTNDYVPWLDIEANIVEWRPLCHFWTNESYRWYLRLGNTGHRHLGHGSSVRLVDQDSPTAMAVAALLAPLEFAAHIHVSWDSDANTLNVHLPRLKLDFFLTWRDADLRSKQYRGMVIDKDQEFGTLTGLSNKLVLKHEVNGSRNVIIPAGNITWGRTDNHVHVKIYSGSALHVPYHCYRIDPQLGRLVDNGTLGAKLFRCYLHALTAHCLPDELTGLTGTEQALQILSEASTLSQTAPTNADLDLLKKIADLTPERTFYPTHLRVMQQVKWSNLPTLSQHASFWTLVNFFCESIRQLSYFQTDQHTIMGKFTPRDRERHLLDRASIRNSYCYIDGFGGDNHTVAMDSTYRARDVPLNSDREARALRTAKLVDQWSDKLCISSSLLQAVKDWNEPIKGEGHSSNCALKLGYNTQWLAESVDIFPGRFLAIWCKLSQSRREKDAYEIMFFLCTLSYSGRINQRFVETLLALATSTELRCMQQPHYWNFTLKDGTSPDRSTLAEIAESASKKYDQCPEIHLPQLLLETEESFRNRRMDQYKANSDKAIERFLDDLVSQWPVFEVQNPAGDDLATYMYVTTAMESTRKKFASWYANFQLENFIERAQNILNSLTSDNLRAEKYIPDYPKDKYSAKQAYVRFDDFLRNPPPRLALTNADQFLPRLKPTVAKAEAGSSLDSLLTKLSEEATKRYEIDYAADITSSLKAFRGSQRTPQSLIELTVAERQLLTEKYLSQCQSQVDNYYAAIVDALWSNSQPAQVAVAAQLSPRLSPICLLRKLSGVDAEKLTTKWKNPLLEYALAISQLQRAQRILNCVNSDSDMVCEVENRGHEGWDPQAYPEWVLLEVENNFLIRPVQARIAQQMISPPSGRNSVMQLNMGEGKSSVIVPIVAATLADRKKLARVVVLKPLVKQMFPLLANKLGGLLGRRIYQIQISRDLRPDTQQCSLIRNLYDECRRNAGILLVQPEHILSFELMGLDQLLAGRTELGNALIGTQQWLNQTSRDILDESDEILSVKFELIYTMGGQNNLEFSPQRWKIVQQVLGLANKSAEDVARNLPRGIEVRPVCSGFKLNKIRLLHDGAGQKLLESVAHSICDSGIPGLPVWNFSPKKKNQLFQFLTDINLSKDNAPLVNMVLHDENARNILLLLRGLLAGGILTFVLAQKRWRVNYGLDLRRSMLAVPYRAKDTPATRAEFSHPDVTLTLTCLTYYYCGLYEDQMYKAFERLAASDNADEEYGLWVADSTDLPGACRQLKGVNLKDRKQCHDQLFPALRFSKSAIDFYLSQVVFPSEMKEFPEKLSSSGWNIARKKIHPTTGFSGTKDSKYLLPLSISQAELDDQIHTNAMQLDCILREENTVQPLMTPYESLDAKTLLELVARCEPPVRVILDAGAQVLELQNEEVAKQWLALAPSAQAVVYFDERNELSVLSREGFKVALAMSPFIGQMDQCLIYLDEAHTRGTDLALPTDYRAAVTLGPGLTKDRLVQACMRMRKLGQGQSVMFCASADIHRKILSCNDKDCDEIVRVPDVLKWSIEETHISTRKACPLWATQGLRYQHQESLALPYKHTPIPQETAESMLEKEAQTITERYGWDTSDRALFDHAEGTPATQKDQIKMIKEKCQQFEIVSVKSAVLQEEQERELSPENERERQVQRPPGLDPAPHKLHRDVKEFMVSGKLKLSSNAFQPAFDTLCSTTAATIFERDAWPKDVLVTADYARTVKQDMERKIDSYLRPVHWVASSTANDKIVLVILSPYEANLAIPLIRQNSCVFLHVYNPRTSGSMRPTDDLTLCAIPATKTPVRDSPEVMQLNLFAGQVYLKTYEEYVALCRFLGLCFKPPQAKVKVFGDGFVDPANREKYDAYMAQQCPFSESPVPLVRALIGYRRKGLGFEKSYMGAILNGELLTRDKFDDGDLHRET